MENRKEAQENYPRRPLFLKDTSMNQTSILQLGEKVSKSRYDLTISRKAMAKPLKAVLITNMVKRLQAVNRMLSRVNTQKQEKDVKGMAASLQAEKQTEVIKMVTPVKPKEPEKHIMRMAASSNIDQYEEHDQLRRSLRRGKRAIEKMKKRVKKLEYLIEDTKVH